MLSKYQCLDLFNCNPKKYVFQMKDQWRMKIDFVSTYRHGHKHQAPNTNVKLFFRTISIFWKIIQVTYS